MPAPREKEAELSRTMCAELNIAAARLYLIKVRGSAKGARSALRTAPRVGSVLQAVVFAEVDPFRFTLRGKRRGARQGVQQSEEQDGRKSMRQMIVEKRDACHNPRRGLRVEGV
jgi:hypothetical protein